MLRFASVAIIGASCFIAGQAAHADNLYAVRPLSGYACMALNLTEEQMFDPSIHVPIMSEPSASSKPLGKAIATVIVASPPHQVNGYLEVLHLDGRRGWIASQYVRPWRNPGTSGHKCIPSLMSDGRPGFDSR
jgi:hypothetical protein